MKKFISVMLFTFFASQSIAGQMLLSANDVKMINVQKEKALVIKDVVETEEQRVNAEAKMTKDGLLQKLSEKK